MAKDNRQKTVTVQSLDKSGQPGLQHAASIPGVSEMIKEDNLLNQLRVYAEQMAVGRPITVEEGTLQQANLWNTIKWVLKLEGAEFVRCYAKLLEFVLENRRGIFSERYAYRFFDSLRMATNERKNFERIMNLILTTCDPRTRALSLKQVDMRTTLGGLVDPLMQQRIAGFYQF